MNFDEILLYLGGFGRFQKRLLCSLILPGMFGAFISLSVLFLMDIPPHRCSLGENDTFQIQDEHHAHLVNMSIPWETYRGESVRSSCNMYKTANNETHWTNETVKCNSWVYDKSIYESTLTEKFNIVCERRMLRSHANMASFVGQMCATLFSGPLADVFGRRPIFLINGLICLASMVGNAFVPHIYVFMVLRAVANMGNLSVAQNKFVMIMELCCPSRRVLAGMVVMIYWCVGLFALGFLAYFIRAWQTLQLVISIPMMSYLIYIWIFPESPRWLISRRRIPEAQRIIRKIASVNKVNLPQEVLESIHLDETFKTVKITEWFKSRSLFVMTMIIFFNWFVASMVYYGIGLNVQNLSGDIFLNFTIGNIVEFVSYICCILLLDRLGRKILVCACMLTGGLACIGTIFPVLYGTTSIDWVTVLLFMVGKFGISAAFVIMFVYTAELFPTLMRNTGLGISSCCARIGGIISPYIADLGILIGGDLKVALPLIVFGAFSVAAGLLSLTLPETLGKKLPETIEDSKSIKRYKSKSSNNYKTDDTKAKDEMLKLETLEGEEEDS